MVGDAVGLRLIRSRSACLGSPCAACYGCFTAALCRVDGTAAWLPLRGVCPGVCSTAATLRPVAMVRHNSLEAAPVVVVPRNL